MTPAAQYAEATREVQALPRVTAKMLMTGVACEYGLTFEDLLQRNGGKLANAARHEAVWVCRQVRAADGSRRYSLNFLAALLDGRHHTSILLAERRFEARLAAERLAA